MKLLNRILIINSALTILLLLFKNSVNHIKTGSSVTVITAPEPVFITASRVGSKGNVSRLTKNNAQNFNKR